MTTAETTDTATDFTPQPDSEIIEATLEALTSAIPVGMNPTRAAISARKLGRSLLTHPQVVAKHTAGLAGSLVKVAAGHSDVEPSSDRRFKDSTFTSNPVYRRVAQTYLTSDQAIESLLDDLDLDPKTRLRADFASNIVRSALAPTNTLLGNPAALKEAKATKGKSLVDGARHAAHDLRNNGAMPSMVDSRPYVPGETVAATPGAVVFSSPVLELIQYAPTTETVYERPVFIIPPQINKYYILDLAPERSLIEHLVSNGQQVFCISWRNARPEHRDWNLDTYVSATIEAMDAAQSVSKSDDLNVLGVCAGGITSMAVLGYLAEIGDTRVNSASLLVTVLDWETPSTVGTFVSPALAQTVGELSKRKGVLSGDDLGRLFAWLRPNDLIWNYWVNNYLMGKNPPQFDVLAWNGDATNLPAGLHKDFMDIAVNNGMAKDGQVIVLDKPISLKNITCDNYIVGAETDHITPWRACFTTADFLGGTSEFVLSSQGHIQALVNPSGNPKGRFFTNPSAFDDGFVDADTWLEGAQQHPGSWWDHWTLWLAERGGEQKTPKKKLGNKRYPAGVAAPGNYVHHTTTGKG